MRDYYSEYVGEKSPNPSRSEGTKGAEGCISPQSTPSAPFAPYVSREIPEISRARFELLDSDEGPSAPFDPSTSYKIPDTFRSKFLRLDSESRQQLLFEIEERIAIMMFDGGLSEMEAAAAAVADVRQAWFGWEL